VFFQGESILMLKAEIGYYGWGWELPNLVGSDDRPLTRVQYDTYDEALEAAKDEIAFVSEFV
jgi:hypothetical protein